MLIRSITATDLDAVLVLLREGFPDRPPSYWRHALEMLGRRPEIPGYPRFGLLLEVNGAAEGVLLLLTSDFGGAARSNLSSWYVRPGHRKFASFLFQRAMREKSSTYLNLSPSAHVLPIAEAFGFRPYTGGTILLDIRSALQRGGRVRGFAPETAGLLDSETQACADVHMAYGCAGLVLEDADGPMLALYRVKSLKHLIPAARFVYGTPERLLRSSGSLMRALLARGLVVALIDAPPNVIPAAGRLLKMRDIRYFRGPTPPKPGDLLETEIAIFGP